MLLICTLLWTFFLLAYGQYASSVIIGNIDLAITPAANNKRYLGAVASSYFGSSVSKAGDVNGDGNVDLIMSGSSSNGAGVAYVIFGNGTSTNTADVDFASFSPGKSGFMIFSSVMSDLLFMPVSEAGDVNGDGFSDVMVGAPSMLGRSGKVFVIFGHTWSVPFSNIDVSLFVAGPTRGFSIGGANINDQLGYSVAAAGDVNGDGRKDIVIGSLNGFAYVIFGPSNTNATTNINLLNFVSGPSTGYKVTGSAEDFFGMAVAGAGDVNGDGISDLIIGASQADPVINSATRTNSGISYVFFGSKGAVADKSTSSLVSGASMGFKINGATTADVSGTSVSGAGDVNGDGIKDIIVGAPQASPTVGGVARSGAGVSYVIFGRNSSIGFSASTDIDLLTFSTGNALGFSIYGAAANDLSGMSLAAAGDVNRDGLSDVIVGAKLADFTGSGVTRADSGMAYVLYGRSSLNGISVSYANIDLATLLTSSTLGFRIIGATSNDYCGASVSSAGDINGDGSSDLIVGSPNASPTSTRAQGGVAYVVFGVFPDPTAVPTRRPSASPSTPPTMLPTTRSPTKMPVFSPTSRPSTQPTRQPSSQPSSQPTRQPTRQPTSQPSSQPSVQPSRQPTGQPSSQPSSQPSAQPFTRPSAQPTRQPSNRPSGKPSARPSQQPTAQPSKMPSRQPSSQPSGQPSANPSALPTSQPTAHPSSRPSSQPTAQPTSQPTAHPSSRPSSQPTTQPTSQPTTHPTSRPSSQPTTQPTSRPSVQPAAMPTSQPTSIPTLRPTSAPSSRPSVDPTAQPTGQPTSRPSARPSTSQPTEQPTSAPTARPSSSPSAQPTSEPSTSQPTARPSSAPTSQPTSAPSISMMPSRAPSVAPTPRPSRAPTAIPTQVPTAAPTAHPTTEPTVSPTEQPSVQPVASPSSKPSPNPTRAPTAQPSRKPTHMPTAPPSANPTLAPSRNPTPVPTRKPSAAPTAASSALPTRVPTVVPGQTQSPSKVPTPAPSLSAETMWRAALSNVLSTVPSAETVAVVHRSAYYELDVPSSTPSNVYGSCSGWRSLLSGDVAASKVLYKPVSVELTVQDALGRPAQHLRCNSTSVVSSVLNSLTNTTSAVGTIQSYSCSGNKWLVSRCSVSSDAPALCVNCIDPCSVQSHCINTESSFTIAPCVTTKCSSESSLAAGLRLLRVSYANSFPAPAFLSRTVVSTTTSLAVTAVLSAPGSVYCAAYVLDPQSGVVPAPASTSSVMLQNFVGASDASNKTVVTITGLQSATDFLVYCLSVSRTGSQQSLSDVLAQPLSPSTTCCIPIDVQTTSGSVHELQSSNKWLAMTVNARPSIDIFVSVSVFNSTGGLVLPVPVFPASFRVNALSSTSATFGMRSTVVSTSPQIRIQTVTMTSSLLALPAGNYTYAVTVSGESVSQYGVVYKQQSPQHMAVLPSNAPLSAPSLSTAVFADDGSYVAISFDSNTNKGVTATQFTCSSLFSFACASTSTCVWTSSKVVSAYMSTAAGCATVGSIVTLAPAAVVTAQCLTGSCNTAGWPRANAAYGMRIITSTSAVSPIVSISAPSSVGACDSLTLDISGSSGNGGRPWLSRSIHVESTATANVTALQYFLSKNYQASPPTAIPAALLTKGFSYNFVVTLCNFLGQCSQASKSVLAMDRTIPTVSLPGATLRTTTRSSTLIIASDAFIAQCAKNSVVRSGLVYSWTVSSGGAVLLGVSSTSKDPSKFVLPPYSLLVGATYDVTLTVTITATAQSASATAQVYVQQGDVKAVVVGGTSQSVRTDSALVVDASGSYDEDQALLTGLSAGLVFTWSCAQVQPVYVGNCDSIVSFYGGFSDGRALVIMSPVSNAAGAVLQLSLFLLDASLTRSAEAVVTVTILAPLSPVVTLASNLASSVVFNSNRELQLTGTVDLSESLNGTAVWSVDDTSNFNFASAVKSPVSVFLSRTSETAVSTVYLVLAANTLPGRVTLTFTLTVSVPQGGLRTLASIVVTTNAPPLPGTFTVSPVNGTEIVDVFTFAAAQWFDSDLPLQYQFAYVSVSGSEVTVRSKLDSAYGSSTLFAGLAARNFNVSCVVYVFDSLAASSSATSVVRVTKQAMRSAAGLRSIITSSLSDAASSVDGLKQATALGSYLLNDVDCSSAPDCGALNRDVCYRTTNTCGECVSDAFVGDAGDSNHACVATTSVSIGAAFQSCDILGHCAPVLKTCAANCSSPQGSCMFVNSDTGAEVSSCFVGATDCNAVCDCREDFIGSETCSLNSTQLLQKQALRSQVILGIQDLVGLEDIDSDTVAGWVGNLVSAAQSPDELSQEGITSLLDTVSTVISSAAQVTGVSVDTLSTLLRSVDASVQASSSIQRRRRRLQSRVANEHSTRLLQESTAALNSTLTRTESILALYRSFVSDSLLPGQDAVSVVMPQFRVLVQKLSLISSSAASNVTLQAPTSALESLTGQVTSSVAVPVGAAQTSLGVSLTSMRSELFNTELSLAGRDQVFSNPLSVEFSDAQCTDSTTCRFELVLQISAAMVKLGDVKSEAVSFNTSCTADDVSIHSYGCPDNSFVTGQCPGYASTVISRCPVASFVPVCNSIAGMSVASSGCHLVHSTSTNITCSCPLQVRRRLQQTTDDDSANNAEASVSYVAMLSQVKDNFVQTILSAQGLNADSVEDGFSAIVTVGCIAAAVLFGLSWAHRADADAAKIKPKSESEKKLSTSVKKSSFVESMRKLFTRKTSRNRAIASKTKWCVNKDVQIAEQALPAILSSNSLSHRVKDEIKNRHKWLGIVFYFSPSFPRVLRVLSLATNVIIMLFIQSLTYSLTNPDDGLCETYTTKPECVAPSSPYATGASKCYWTTETSECALVQPDGSVKIILFVAIFSAIIATPLAMLIDWLVFNVLSAPTRTAHTPKVVTSEVNDANDLSPNLAIVPNGGSGRHNSRKRSSLSGSVRSSVFGSVVGTDGVSVDLTATLSAQSDMSKLVQELTAYRTTLTAEQRVEFDAIWGLDENGYFCSGDESVSVWKRVVGTFKSAFESDQKSGNSSASNVSQRVLMDLKSVHVGLLTETATAIESNLPEQEKGKRLLFLFQCDLLPGISGKILDSKGKRDNLTVRHVSFQSKVAVWTFLAAANVGMLFYILLFALSQTVHRQGAWALSFVMWLVVEVLFVSSATVIFTHILIPSLIMQDVNKIKLKLVESIRAFNNGVRSRNRESASQKGPEHFNAADYLFVSTRLAKEWSDLREAQIIALFRTPWPKQSYQREADVSQTYSRKYTQLYRSVSIVAIFFLTNLLQIPPAFQDMVIHMCTTAAVGYTVLLHIDLYDVFPALVIVPCLIIGIAIYALIRYNAKRAQRRLEQTFPMGDLEEVQDAEAVKIDAFDKGVSKFDTDDPEVGADSEDAVIARVAMDLSQSGELHLPPPDVNSLSTASAGHTTRKQSVVQGLRVLSVLKESRAEVAEVVESDDCSESESDLDDESKQDEVIGGEVDRVYSENLYSIDELQESVDADDSNVEESESEHFEHAHTEPSQLRRASSASKSSAASLTFSEEEAFHNAFHEDSDLEYDEEDEGEGSDDYSSDGEDAKSFGAGSGRGGDSGDESLGGEDSGGDGGESETDEE